MMKNDRKGIKGETKMLERLKKIAALIGVGVVLVFFYWFMIRPCLL